jgi:DNA-binding MarR family transcriptional regulator
MADRFMVTLHELTAAMDTYADALLRRDHGMTFNEFEYLVVVGEHDRADITELAGCLRLTKAAVSKRLPALEAADLVRRTVDPSNRRRVLVSLTAGGGQRLQAAAEHLEAELDTVFHPADPLADELDTDRLNADLLTLFTRIKAKELPQ